MTAEQLLSTPESRMSLPWVTPDASKYQFVRDLLSRWKINLPESPKAFQGAGLLAPAEGAVQNPEDQKYLADDRPIAVVPGRRDRNAIDFDSVVHIPAKDIAQDKRFDATLAGYRGALAKFVESTWSPEEGASPIPVALTTGLRDGRFITITELRRSLTSLGEGGPAESIHTLNLHELPLEEIPHLIDVLGAIHVPSANFIQWLERSKINIATESWLKEGNAYCALRGHEWWINSDKNKDDRLKELTRYAELTPPETGEDKYLTLRSFYQEYFAGIDFSAALESMIRNNLPLYRYQNGKLTHDVLSAKDEKFLGESVVVHGVLSPSNIHKKLNPQTGRINYTITGGDRSQLYGLRGQMIDWLVAATAESPDYQRALINNFLERYQKADDPYQKERRGLAMHVMYRSIAEAHWCAEHATSLEDPKWKRVENLVHLASQIIKGEDVWKGVNTDIKSISA